MGPFTTGNTRTGESLKGVAGQLVPISWVCAQESQQLLLEARNRHWVIREGSLESPLAQWYGFLLHTWETDPIFETALAEETV